MSVNLSELQAGGKTSLSPINLFDGLAMDEIAQKYPELNTIDNNFDGEIEGILNEDDMDIANYLNLTLKPFVKKWTKGMQKTNLHPTSL